jgi:Ca2+-dependent lipid-binding protein
MGQITLGGTNAVKSRVHDKTLNPVWNQTFDLCGVKPLSVCVCVCVCV